MKKLLAIVAGFAIAILLGWLYLKFSGPLVYKEPLPVKLEAGFSFSANAVVLAIVLFSWVTAFMTLPQWLAGILDVLIGFLGVVLFVVMGVFVWLAQPFNTLADTTYVNFLCGIAMAAVRVVRILRMVSRGDIE